MRTMVTVAAFALFSLVQPASAQMCGSGQQAQASTPGQSMGGMMCGAASQAQDDPMADKPAQPQQRSGGMCPCCRNMAMMRGGGMMQHQGMPGMEQPKE
jgi:hypothetical protein